MSCKAVRSNEQMHCARCGFMWDIDDPDRPECMTDDERIKQIRELITNGPPARINPPVEPFANVREKMRLRCRTQFPNISVKVLDSIIYQTINEVQNECNNDGRK